MVLFVSFLLICSASTSKLNVLVTKLHEFLAHAAVEDGGQTPTSKDAEEGTVDATRDKKTCIITCAGKTQASLIFFRFIKQVFRGTFLRPCCVTGK